MCSRISLKPVPCCSTRKAATSRSQVARWHHNDEPRRRLPSRGTEPRTVSRPLTPTGFCRMYISNNSTDLDQLMQHCIIPYSHCQYVIIIIIINYFYFYLQLSCVVQWWNIGISPANFHCPTLDLQLMGDYLCG